MSERIVNDPSQHGWVEENGKWVWEGGSTTGHIEDGTIDGQITTWDVAKTEWTPEGGVVVSGGNVGIGYHDPQAFLHLYSPDSTILLQGDGADTRGRVSFLGRDSSNRGHKQNILSDDGDMVFETGGYQSNGYVATERMRIDANGNVGIGRSSPSAVLDVAMKAGDYTKRIQTSFPNGSTGDASFGWKFLWGGNDNSPEVGLVHGGSYDNAGLYFDVMNGGAQNRAMSIDASGRVDITGSLYVNGAEVGSGGGGAYVPLTGNSTVNGTITATDFIATSDERLKDDISPLPVGLIDDIKPVQWNWKDGSGKSAGVIAQQLQAIGLDDFVNEDADGNLGVNYNALVGVLLAEVISLKAEVEALK